MRLVWLGHHWTDRPWIPGRLGSVAHQGHRPGGEMRELIETVGAPAPVGPYSVGVATDSLLFCAAQAGLDPQTGGLVRGGTGPETERAMKNLAAVLDAGGLSFADVVKTTVFLVDIADFGIVNEVYGRLIGDRPPARTTVAVAALPIGARIEIEMIAARR
jgi:2-iminobutanoate/2-iminopropanoate deaminase